MGPLIAVVLFLTAITTAFWYLKSEELEREQELVRRDVEYAQQRLRVRLLDKQEQIVRMTRAIANREMDLRGFQSEAQAVINQSPEISSITWLDAQQRVRGGYISSYATTNFNAQTNELLMHPETSHTFELTRDLLQPIYSQPIVEKRANAQTYTELHCMCPS